MIRVTVELIPQGDERAKRTIRTMTISKTEETIDAVYLADTGKRRATVRGHKYRSGPWALVFRAIQALSLDMESGW